MDEAKITRIKGRQTVELDGGRTIEVDEIVYMDYGKKGKTTVYIKPPSTDRRIDVAGINAVAGKFGMKLVEHGCYP